MCAAAVATVNMVNAASSSPCVASWVVSHRKSKEMRRRLPRSGTERTRSAIVLWRDFGAQAEPGAPDFGRAKLWPEFGNADTLYS